MLVSSVDSYYDNYNDDYMAGGLFASLFGHTSSTQPDQAPEETSPSMSGMYAYGGTGLGLY